MKVADLVLANLRKNENFKTVNEGIAVGAYFLAIIALVFGGSVSAMFTGLLNAIRGGGTVEPATWAGLGGGSRCDGSRVLGVKEARVRSAPHQP